MDQDPNKKPPSGCGVLLVLYNTVFRRRATTAAAADAGVGAASPASSSVDPAVNSYSSPKSRRSDSSEASLLPVLAPRRPKAAAPAPPAYGRHAARMSGISTDLDAMIHDHQRTKGSTTLVRASSGNVMVFSHLGNIRAPGAVTPNRNVLDYLPKTANELAAGPKPSKNQPAGPVEAGAVMCRALSRRLDPEELKEMGNEEYKKGRFAEAVALYERAILMDPDKASYWSNKAAGLTGVGRLIDAVADCREAVRIDPSYHRAHQRLAALYLRLGIPEKALHHYKLSRNEASSSDISRAQAVQTHLSKCREARKLRDWNTMLKQADSAVSSGADSAPQVFASKAEALLMLQKHEEADKGFNSAPKFEIDASTKFFGAPSNAYFLSVRAQVDMAAGRFEDAVSIAHKAYRLDPSNRDVSVVAHKARNLASARSKGNDLFKASKLEEACVAYGEGLNHDSQNAILLCNRAACLTKLGKWEKAIEDCNAALNLRPSYGKALLRRADCNSKLKRWDASVRDYEALLCAMPEDEEVGKALLEAQVQLKKQRGNGFVESNCGSNLVRITSKEQFDQILTASGLSVALFFSKTTDISRRTMPFMEQICKQYPSLKFLKVDIEGVPYLAKSECVDSVPTFRIYKDGSIVKDIVGSNQEQLENSLKMLTK